MQSLSRDILLEAQQLQAPYIPHLPILVLMLSLLRLNSQRPALCLGHPRTSLLQNCSHWPQSCSHMTFFMSASHLPWGHVRVVRVEHENVCCTPGSWLSWMLCRCLVLHLLDQGIMLLFMLTPLPKELSHAFPLNASLPAETLTIHH